MYPLASILEPECSSPVARPADKRAETQESGMEVYRYIKGPLG